MSKVSLKAISNLIDSAMNGSSVGDNFLTDLQHTISARELANRKKPSQSLKPSSMKCERNMYYQLSGADTDQDSADYTIIGIGESGTDRHERLQDAVCSMKDYGVDCEYIDPETFAKEHNLTDLVVKNKTAYETHFLCEKYNLSFLCDGIIKYKGEYYILEIKTEASFKWNTREGVDKAHFNQAYTYSLCFGINKVLFVYENRDNCSKKAFVLEVGDGERRNIENKIIYVQQCVKDNNVPPKSSDANCCKYCLYKSQCMKDKYNGYTDNR